MKPKAPKKKKSIFEGLEKALKKFESMTPEQKAAFSEGVRKKIAEQDKDADDKRWKRGKYDPILKPVGWCKVCQRNTVVEKWTILRSDSMMLGGPSNATMGLVGHYCVSCGLSYEFPPPEPK